MRIMKLLYIAGREGSYSRTRNVLNGLRENGVEVVPCFPPNKSFTHYPKLIFDYLRRARGCDLIIVGFYGQLLLPFVRLFTAKKIIFDMYIATYDTMVFDRGAAAPGTLRAKLFYLSDRLACQLSDKIVLETEDHIADFSRKFGIDREKFSRIFLATDDSVLYPKERGNGGGKFLVHFHGEYAPFHGVRHIIKAAHLLRDEDVVFQIIGTGITYEADRRLAEELEVQNIRFIDWVQFEELADYMARADVCLGIFGENERTLRVTTNKVIEAIAVRKPLITGRNEPVQELLTHGESVFLCERGDPDSLAAAILTLKKDRDLRERIARGGYEVFTRHCTTGILGGAFTRIAEELLNER